MLAGAVMQYLESQGMPRVGLTMADFNMSDPPAIAVHASPDADAELDTGAYHARIQLRARAANVVAAENANRIALALLQAADGSTLAWWDETGTGPNRMYRVEAIRVMNRPTWYATPDPGQETSCNVALHVTEL